MSKNQLSRGKNVRYFVSFPRVARFRCCVPSLTVSYLRYPIFTISICVWKACVKLYFTHLNSRLKLQNPVTNRLEKGTFHLLIIGGPSTGPDNSRVRILARSFIQLEGGILWVSSTTIRLPEGPHSITRNRHQLVTSGVETHLRDCQAMEFKGLEWRRVLS